MIVLVSHLISGVPVIRNWVEPRALPNHIITYLDQKTRSDETLNPPQSHTNSFIPPTHQGDSNISIECTDTDISTAAIVSRTQNPTYLPSKRPSPVSVWYTVLYVSSFAIYRAGINEIALLEGLGVVIFPSQTFDRAYVFAGSSGVRHCNGDIASVGLRRGYFVCVM